MNAMDAAEARASSLGEVHQTKILADVRLTGTLRSDGARSEGSEVDRALGNGKGRPWESGGAHRKQLKPGQIPEVCFSLAWSQVQQCRVENTLFSQPVRKIGIRSQIAKSFFQN